MYVIPLSLSLQTIMASISIALSSLVKARIVHRPSLYSKWGFGVYI